MMKRAAFVIATVIALAPCAAFAQTSQADEVFFQARQLAAAGNYAEACPMFEKSQAMRPGIGTLLNLGDCYEKLGDAARAYKTFRDARDAAKRAGDPRESVATSRLAALESRVTVVTVTIERASDVSGLAIQLDGHALERTELADLVVERGTHTLVATAPTKTPLAITLDATGTTATAAIAFPVVADTHEQPSTRARSPQRTIGVVVAGVGLVSIIVGSVMGGLSLANKGTGNQHCMLGPSANECDPTGIDARNSAITFGDLSTGFILAGGIALAAGIVLWIAAPRAPKSIALTLARGFTF